MADTPSKEDELAGTEQPFVQHLMELRDRLLYCIYGLVVAGVILAFWPTPSGLIDLIAAPIRAHMPPDAKLIAVGVFTPFFVPLKVLLMAAVLLALPWLGFVQFFVLDKMFAFIQKVTPASVAATPDIASYVESILSLYIAFGLAFQVPIVVMLLARFGLVTIEKLRAFRGYFIVVAFVIAAVVTPPDVISQLALAVPMCILYEVGIWAAQFFIRYTRAPDEKGEASDKTEEGAAGGSS